MRPSNAQWVCGGIPQGHFFPWRPYFRLWRYLPRVRCRGGLRTAPTTNECLQCFFTHPVLFTQRIDGIPTSCQRRRESSPSAHGAIMISAPGIFLLYPSYVQGSFLSSLPRLPFLDSRLRMNDDVESMTSLLEYRWCLNNVVTGVFRLCAATVRVRVLREEPTWKGGTVPFQVE